MFLLALKLIVIVFWLRLDCNKNKKRKHLKKYENKSNVFCILNDCGNVKLWHVPIFIHVFGIKRLRALNLSGFVCSSFSLYIFIVRINCDFNFNFSMKNNKIYFSQFHIKKKKSYIYRFKEKKMKSLKIQSKIRGTYNILTKSIRIREIKQNYWHAL